MKHEWYYLVINVRCIISLPPRHSKSLAIEAVAFGVGMLDDDLGCEAGDFVGWDVVFKLKRSKFELRVVVFFSVAEEAAFLGGDSDFFAVAISFGL